MPGKTKFTGGDSELYSEVGFATMPCKVVLSEG